MIKPRSFHARTAGNVRVDNTEGEERHKDELRKQQSSERHSRAGAHRRWRHDEDKGLYAFSANPLVLAYQMSISRSITLYYSFVSDTPSLADQREVLSMGTFLARIHVSFFFFLLCFVTWAVGIRVPPCVNGNKAILFVTTTSTWAFEVFYLRSRGDRKVVLRSCVDVLQASNDENVNRYYV